MKILQYIKKLTKSNCGLTNMNDSYITVFSKARPFDFFGTRNAEFFLDFRDNINGSIMNARVGPQSNGEFRIYQLKNFIKNHNALPGDCIIIERIENNSQIEFKIDLIAEPNKVCFVKDKTRNQFEGFDRNNLNMMNENDERVYDIFIDNEYKKIKIKFIETTNDKRNISHYYKVYIDGNDIIDNVNADDFVELIFNKTYNTLRINKGWQKYEYNF